MDLTENTEKRRKTVKKIFGISLIAVGFTSMASQIVLMRELLSVFYGNEMTIGLALFAWLLWVGCGSWLAGKIPAQTTKKEAVLFFVLQTTYAFLLPAVFIFIRAIPAVFKLMPGQIFAPSVILSLSIISLSLVCILTGFLFILACRLFVFCQNEKKLTIGTAYLLEAAGAGLGGLAVSFFLFKEFFPLQIILFLSCLNLISALAVSLKYKTFKTAREKIPVLIIFFIFAVVFFIFLFKIPLLRDYSLNLRWHNQNLIYSTDTIYSNIAITAYDKERTFYINGLLSFSTQDKAAAENTVHFPMLQHPEPKRILVIGGGAGVLNEIIKYNVKQVDYVELDPKIIELMLKFTPLREIITRAQGKIKLISNIDARLFVRRTRKNYDVVIFNLPQPHTTQLNRFYTLEFFKEIRCKLAYNGIFSFSLAGNPDYISEEQKNLYLCLSETLKDVFEETAITPGSNNYFLASKKKNALVLKWEELISRLKERKIETLYFREYYLFSELSDERINTFLNSMKDGQKILLNTDFRPRAYYYDIILYSSFFKNKLTLFLKEIKKINILFLLLSACLLIIFLAFVRKTEKRNFGILTCITTTGFSEILFQIVILFAFQTIYGYVYYKLSVIFAFFMIGLVAGAYLVTRLIKKGGSSQLLFIKTQIYVCLYPLLLPLIFSCFKNNQNQLAFFIGSNIVFPSLPFIAGFMGGFQFPLAVELYLKEKTGFTRAVSITYGLDLFGASLAAALTAVVFIPILGLWGTCLLAGLLNTAGLTALIAGER